MVADVEQSSGRQEAGIEQGRQLSLGIERVSTSEPDETLVPDDPFVWSAFVRRIAFSGPASVGKRWQVYR